MNACPDDVTLANLVTGQIGGEERHEMLRHVRLCKTCQETVRRLTHLADLLSCANMNDKGEIVLQPPIASSASDQRLKATVLKTFRKKRERIAPLRARIESLLAEIAQFS